MGKSYKQRKSQVKWDSRGKPPKDKRNVPSQYGNSVHEMFAKEYGDDLEYYIEELSHLGLKIDDVEEVLEDFDNPLKYYIDFDGEPDRDLLRFMRHPDNWGLTCRLLFGLKLLPFQIIVLQELFAHPFPIILACRGGSKTFMLGVYNMIMSTLYQGTKIIMVGTGFRQSRLIFEVMEKIYLKNPIVRDLIGNYEGSGITKHSDKWTIKIGDSEAHALPIGAGGQKIRGFRANIVEADEFQSQNPQIYEEVIRGFTSTASDPVEKVAAAARRETLMELGRWDEYQQKNYDENMKSNQSIISGTADYDFGHFARYVEKYESFIKSRGDSKSLGSLAVAEGVTKAKWTDFAVFRIPYDLFPSEYLDMVSVSQSKEMMSKNLFSNEFCCTFSKDSNGFFPMSLIYSRTADNPNFSANAPQIGKFSAMIRGSLGYKYVYGIDPAFKNDNLAIVILECHGDHRRVVHCWTTNGDNHKKRVAMGLAKENEYYSFVARKIRDLMKVFPPEVIAIDSQGGGENGVLEALHDKDKLQEGDVPIWAVRHDHILSPDKKEKDSDNKAGLHIVELVYFSDYEYTSMANNTLKKDLEDYAIVFPGTDTVEMAVAHELDQQMKLKVGDKTDSEYLFDTLADCVQNIDELKLELAAITVAPTPNGNRYRWDTPEISEGLKKGRMKKDRYSALIMANAAARRITRFDPPKISLPNGNYVGQFTPEDRNGQMHKMAPDWFSSWEPLRPTR